ncbi:MAG: hypothetical protein E7200_04775 [Selenomonas ruminantium]|nr:hypothetical protein [Selenomonas ruminantium]
MNYLAVATEAGIFSYMKKCLEVEKRYKKISPFIRQNFVLLRKHAEELARFRFSCTDGAQVDLAQIYDALSMTGELTEEEAGQLATLEREARHTFKIFCSGLENHEEGESNIAWLSAGLEEDFSAQLLAGAASRTVLEGNLQGVGKLGATLGGPILMPYVEWLLGRSLSLGFKRLFFIARDGYILKRMADVLIERKGLNIKTFYIHGSRRAWRMPSYQGKIGELKELVGWSHGQHICSAEDLADVLQISVEDLRPHLMPEYVEKGHRLAFEELSAVIMQLDKSDKFRVLLQQKLSAKRQLVVDYLQQEVDVSDEKFAFVELGGGGLTQTCLARLMEIFYKGPIRTFFYKMDRVCMPNDECIFYDFFPSKMKNDLIVEMICRAPEGQTEGYCREGRKVVPVKKEEEAEIYREKGYEEYIRGIDIFTKFYAESVVRFEPNPSLKTSLACIDYISHQENNEVNDFFAGLPNRVTGRENNTPSFAPPLTKTMVRDIYIRHVGTTAWSYYPGTDFDMSVKRSELYVQRKVDKYKKEGGMIRERWLKMFQPIGETRSLQGWWQCPYSLLGRKVVLYGAGKRGQRWYNELSADRAIEVVQWLDKDYLFLKDKLPVTGDMNSLGQNSFDWVMIDFADEKLMESVMEEMQHRGVDIDKIYYPARISEWISEWITYLNV